MLGQPIFVTGPARSGTSLVAGAIRACGAWTGPTIGGSAENPHGFVEHERIREEVTKKLLRQLGADPRGVDPLPPADTSMFDIKYTSSQLRFDVVSLIEEDGYCVGPWLFKDAKMSYLWPFYDLAFSDLEPVWVVVVRPDHEVIDSCMRTGFMRSGRQGGQDREFWVDWLLETRLRLGRLAADASWQVVHVSSRDLMRGDYSAMVDVCRCAGLEYNEQAIAGWVDPKAWHGGY